MIFGGTGDLAHKKLIPSLIQLSSQKQLPQDFICIGVGRNPKTDNQYRHELQMSLEKYSPELLHEWQRVKSKFVYFQGNHHNPNDFARLSVHLKNGKCLFYLSTPASHFIPIIEGLNCQKLLDNAHVIIEKPFGHDLESAQKLQERLTTFLSEPQIFRMDHYLGKEAVRGLAKETHGLSKENVERIEIHLCEEIGIGTRGHFFEETGTLRDVVQNHMMQILTHLTMGNGDKVGLLNSIRLVEVERGQYASYRQEPHVNPQSTIETYVFAKLFIDNDRWKDVPIYLKAGKRLSKKETAIIITTRDGAKRFIDLSSTDWPYARLTYEAMQGDQTYFVQYDELEASWRIWTPVLHDWQTNLPLNFPTY